jgi:septal ring factor EnvC (AmiA/AmiB activator)
MKYLSLIVCLVLMVGYLTSVQAVTDAELEALEKQIEQQEAEEKQQAELEVKRKAESEKQRLEETKRITEEKEAKADANRVADEKRKAEVEVMRKAEEEAEASAAAAAVEAAADAVAAEVVGFDVVDARGRYRYRGTVEPGQTVVADNDGVTCSVSKDGRFRCRGRGLTPNATVTITIQQ